ncbi:MAG: hypothetical protein R3E18_12825 [Sphingomonadaceae bacterium]|nr:hypothetical protein [Sphingomonadaceae bacterium]
MNKVANIFKGLFSVGSLCAAILIAAPAAHAQEAVALDGKVKVERVETVDGKEQTVFKEPTSVVPGDKLVFSTAYRNTSTQPVDNFVVTNPLPGAVMLAETDDSFEVSVDGGATFGALADLTITDAEAGQRAAKPADVTHIRWTLARIAPGEEGVLEYHAIVR